MSKKNNRGKRSTVSNSKSRRRVDCKPSSKEGSCSSIEQDVKLFDRTEALIRGLQLVLEHHKCPEILLEDGMNQVRSYLNKSDCEKEWLQCAKHLLAFPISVYLDNSPPPPPPRAIALEGGFRRWMQNRVKVFNKANTHLWYSWYQAKRASLPVSEEIVADTYTKHFELLSSEDSGEEATISSIFTCEAFVETLDEVRNAVKQRQDELFTYPELHPSTSACYEGTRKDGGQRQILRYLADLIEDYQCDDLTVRESVLSKMEWVPFSHRVQRSEVKEVREPYGRSLWETLRYRPKPTESLSCIIQAVLEPMKVRVISKGEALHYYRAKPLQRILHDTLREMQPFRLIGRPLAGTDLLSLKENSFTYKRVAKYTADHKPIVPIVYETVPEFPRENYEWFSVDYSAATDNLSYKYSGRIFEYVIQDLDEETKSYLRWVLGFHKLYYPAEDGTPVYWGDMKRGQLMGSILSFPILCLANFGVYCLNMYETGLNQGWSTQDYHRRVLVNGDDMLYAAPPHLWESHIAIGKDVGLEMSVGKAYRHPVYLNINSTSFHYDLNRFDSLPSQVDFLNAGLFFGQHKVQSSDKKAGHAASHHDDPSSYAACANELMRGCFRDHSKLLARYISLHKEDISREAMTYLKLRDGSHTRRLRVHRNLFLPVSIGGLGIEAPRGFRFRITKMQKLLACSIALDFKSKGLIVDTQLPRQGYEPRLLLEVPEQPWSEACEVRFAPEIDLDRSEEFISFREIKNGMVLSMKNPNHSL